MHWQTAQSYSRGMQLVSRMVSISQNFEIFTFHSIILNKQWLPLQIARACVLTGMQSTPVTSRNGCRTLMLCRPASGIPERWRAARLHEGGRGVARKGGLQLPVLQSGEVPGGVRRPQERVGPGCRALTACRRAAGARAGPPGANAASRMYSMPPPQRPPPLPLLLPLPVPPLRPSQL